MSSKISLNRPSYRFRMVFLVERYSGQPFESANWNEECANAMILSSRLYMAIATPLPLYSNTVSRDSSPFSGLNTNSNYASTKIFPSQLAPNGASKFLPLLFYVACHAYLPRPVDYDVGRLVLVPVGVSPDHDRLSPARY